MGLGAKRFTVPRSSRKSVLRRRWIRNYEFMELVGVICPGGVKTEFALGRGRTQEGVSNSDMLEPEDVAGAVLLACKQSPGSRIIEIQMRTMAESLA